MAKHLLGAYPTEEDLRKAVTVYELSGHESKHVVVFTNEEQAQALGNRTRFTIKTDSPAEVEESAGMMTKLKERFKNAIDVELDTTEKLMDYGLSEEDAEMALYQAKLGQFVVIVDDELRMGHH